jgi:DNA polymerase V
MSKGGARPGAGRKANSGVYGEKTVAKRIPVSLLPSLDQFIKSWKEREIKPHPKLKLPLFAGRVPAGFPSPADDFLETALDLNQHLIQHPAATFFVRTSGDSMIQAGIHNNDILVVDRSLEAKSGSIVIAVVNGELTVKRLHIKGENMILKPENPNYPDLAITEEMAFQIWGVVTSVIHEFKGAS